MATRTLFITATFLCLPAIALAQENGSSSESEVEFVRDIQPILAQKCFHCHGPDDAKAGLRLNQREPALAELKSGKRPIVPGKPEESELFRRISAENESVRMPHDEKPLSEEQIELVRRWIEQGAHWQKHWSFRSPQPQTPPEVKNDQWVRNPVDAFILSRLEQNDLQPAPPAQKVALIRRAYYDLTGLPPTPQEVEAFLQDDSPNAYEKVVDRLLDSPRYGERWGRHWLDLVRYADTNSYERDGVKPNAWRFRDYVIRSFNQDKPYDQFIKEQLAGDELDKVTTDSIIATGYYRLGLWDDEPADPFQARFDEFDDIITTTSQVFLGLTINCARCHDHKIDPIPQKDYYSMLAFFRGMSRYGIRSDQTGNNQTDISPPQLKKDYIRLAQAIRETQKKMKPIERKGIVKMSAEDQRKSEGPKRKELLDQKLQQYLEDEDWQKYTDLKKRLQKLQKQKEQLPPRKMALSVTRCNPDPPPTHILNRGNAHVKGEKVEPDFPSLFDAPKPEIPEPPEDADTARRRRILAQWIASPDNKLTSRVMVNRIWQFHFGRGIVRSPNNFGQLGEPPTHPKLLDWLAAEFVKRGWRLKPMHKLIMMSNTYRMSSQADEKALAQDPNNDLFWRFNMRRLSAEEIRDSIHAVNGRLNLEMYGPGYYPDISEEVLAGQSRPGSGWGNSSLKEQARRSIYIHVKRSLITPILADFDFPETDSSCAARFQTTQPSQALGMLNGEFVNREAKFFAERLRREAGDDPRDQVTRALELALCRDPKPQEIDRGVKFLEKVQRKHNVDSKKALDYYCLMVLNLNEFIYLD